jgi:hypothetical protein
VYRALVLAASALIATLVASVWVVQLPKAIDRLVTAYQFAIDEGSAPKKRTPQKSRTWQRLDDFDDVRARIREQMQSPKQ